MTYVPPTFPPDEQSLKAEENRSNVTVLKNDVLRIIKTHFGEQFELLKARPQQEQNIIGNTLTILESEVKKSIKQLPEFSR